MTMKRLSFLITVFLVNLFLSAAFAQTITLKSGKKIQGKILQRTEYYIKVDIAGVPLTYFLDDIYTIEAEQVVPPNPQQAVLPPNDAYKQAWRKDFGRQKPDWINRIRGSFRFERVSGIYLIIFPLLMLLGLFFGFSLQTILILVAGLIASVITRMMLNDAGAANTISYICALFTAYFVMKSEIYHS